MCSLDREIDMAKYNKVNIADIEIGDLVKVCDKPDGYMNGRNFKAFVVEMRDEKMVVEPMRIGPQETFVTVRRDTIREAKRKAA